MTDQFLTPIFLLFFSVLVLYYMYHLFLSEVQSCDVVNLTLVLLNKLRYMYHDYL